MEIPANGGKLTFLYSIFILLDILSCPYPIQPIRQALIIFRVSLKIIIAT